MVLMRGSGRPRRLGLASWVAGLLFSLAALVRLARLFKAAPRAKLSEEEKPGPAPALADAQLRKIEIEIDDLKRRGSWDRRVARYLPLASVVVTVSAFVFGIYQFRSELQKNREARETEQRIRFQNQLRADLDQLLQFARDDKQTVSTASLLLLDLKYVLDARINERETMRDSLPGYERSVTTSLVTMLANDSDFGKRPRDVSFAVAVLEHWPDYKSFLGENENAGRLDYVLDMHVQAVRDMRDKNPGFFEGLEYNAEINEFLMWPEHAHLLPHFLDIKESFLGHVKLFREGADARARAIREKNLHKFESALCKPAVAKPLLGPDFSGQPCEK